MELIVGIKITFFLQNITVYPPFKSSHLFGGIVT